MEILNAYHEDVLKHLLDLRRSANFQTFMIGFLQNSLSSRDDFLKPILFDALCSLHSQGYIFLQTQAEGVQNITSLTILPQGLDYFQNKQRYLADKRKEDIWRLAPIVISILALIVSITALCKSW